METVVVVAVTLLLGKCVMVRSACVSHHPCFDQLYLFTVDGRIQTPNWFKPSSDVFLDVLCFMKLREENDFIKRGEKKFHPSYMILMLASIILQFHPYPPLYSMWSDDALSPSYLTQVNGGFTFDWCNTVFISEDLKTKMLLVFMRIRGCRWSTKCICTEKCSLCAVLQT